MRDIRGKLTALIALSVVAASLVGPRVATAGPQKGSDGSGPRATAHRAGGREVPSKDAPSPRLMRLGVDSSEPTLGVTQDGKVFTSAIQTNTRVEVLRSADNGKTWETVSPRIAGRNAQLLSFDPYTYVDLPRSDQDLSRVFTIDLTIACSYLSYSDDAGDSWFTNPLVCGRPVNDHQTLFGGPPVTSPTIGYPNIIYYCWNDIATSSCQKSLDGGITFTATGTPAFPGVDPQNGGTQLCGGLHGHGFVDDAGTVYIPRGYCGQPWLAISKDEGRTWERVQVAKGGVTGHEASVVADGKGNIFYTYVGKDRLPYLVVSKDGGKKWSKPMMVGAPGVNEANLPSIALGGKGKIAIAYMGTTNSPGEPFPEATECTAIGACPEPEEYKNTTWHGYMTISADALDKEPTFYSAPINDPKDPLIRGTCGPGRCKAVYDFIDVVIDRDGVAWSAFVDGCMLACITGPANMGSEGIIGRFDGGPRLD
ncbi:MAG: sialidase family protein [Actinomycetota bacterium]